MQSLSVGDRIMTSEEFSVWLSARLVEIGNELLVHFDPCAIQGSSCKAGDPNPCCMDSVYGPGPCQYLRDGCTDPNPRPTCKLWLCRTAIATTDPVCVETLALLEKVGLLFNIVLHPVIGERYRGADWRP